MMSCLAILPFVRITAQKFSGMTFVLAKSQYIFTSLHLCCDGKQY